MSDSNVHLSKRESVWKKQKTDETRKSIWILYDVGNSAFVLLVSTIIPIYFNYLTGTAGVSEVNSLAYWGYAASAATIIVALIGPILGTIADTKNYKKPLFTISMDGRCDWLCGVSISDFVGCVFSCFCHCKSRI